MTLQMLALSYIYCDCVDHRCVNLWKRPRNKSGYRTLKSEFNATEFTSNTKSILAWLDVKDTLFPNMITS